ncbi:hypothetical protein C8R43DRAFT_1127176 [Mycena crocata]|nr:hypothetical protein C8R43DRAFT_1127176 [Mycena crocata]
MSSDGYGTVTLQPNRLPIVSTGKLKPADLALFEYGCNNYFSIKSTPTASKVAVSLACFQCPLIISWLRPTAEVARVSALPWSEYMDELRVRLLDVDWESKTRTQLLQMRMHDTETFGEYYTRLVAVHSLLINTPSQFDNSRLRYTIEAGMIPTLSHMCGLDDKAKVVAIEKLDEWIVEARHIDADRVEINRRIAAEVEARTSKADKRRADNDGDRKSKKPNSNGERPPNSTGSNGSSSSYNNNNGTPRVATLDDSERDLLKANDGCTKCRQPFVFHNRFNCNNDWPTPATYQRVTPEFIAAAKKRMNEKNGKGASSSGSSSKAGPSVAVVMPSADIDDVDDEDDSTTDPSSDVSNLTCHTSAHLYWDCLIEGPMSNLPIELRALIDNGVFIAMIDDDVVEALGLRRFKLHTPEKISLALSSGTSNETSLTEYVKLRLISRDQSWVSTTVRAVIAPNLCAPVILGLPWLEKNKIVIDHDMRSAVDKRTGYDLLNPPPPKIAPAPKT